MNYMHKDKKWLIEFCNKLKEELAWCKDRVKVAEKIMYDLKATGQESVESLIRTIDGFEAKKLRLEKEIADATYVVNKKEALSQAKTDKIEDCKQFIETQSGIQQQKIEDLSEKISDKKAYILELQREIASLEYKNEYQNNTMVDLQFKIGKKLKRKMC